MRRHLTALSMWLESFGLHWREFTNADGRTMVKVRDLQEITALTLQLAAGIENSTRTSASVKSLARARTKAILRRLNGMGALTSQGGS